jgi:hypothetical protein
MSGDDTPQDKHEDDKPHRTADVSEPEPPPPDPPTEPGGGVLEGGRKA